MNESDTMGFGRVIPSAVAPSVAVLREHGCLNLREVTRLTARRMGCSLMYADVDAVLRCEMAAGRVEIINTTLDYRDCVWRATDARASRHAERRA